MNCVAIPPTEDKRRTLVIPSLATASSSSTSSSAAQPLRPPVHMMRSEITLTTSIVEPSNNTGSRRIDCAPDVRNRDSKLLLPVVGGKTRSLQRTATTHLYCRSLDKEAAAGALAVSQRKLASGSSAFAANATSSSATATSSSSSSSRGFASCLRGEKDDASTSATVNDYQRRNAGINETSITIVHQPQQLQPHLSEQIDDELDENHPVKVLQTSLLSIGSGGDPVAGGSRKCHLPLSSNHAFNYGPLTQIHDRQSL